MSDFGVEAVEEAVKESVEVTAETIAMQSGWQPRDEWIDNGRKPEEHVSAEVYNAKGELISKLKKQQSTIDNMKHDFDNRLKSVNQLHNIQIESERARLSQQRDSFVEDGNVSAVRSTQAQIDALRPIVEPPQQRDNAFVEYEANNEWVTGNGAKALYAKSQVAHYQSMNFSPTDALNAMEQDLMREFPNSVQSPHVSVAEKAGSRVGKRSSSGKLTMNDITSDERKMYGAIDWSSDDAFLQAVKDSRAQ